MNPVSRRQFLLLVAVGLALRLALIATSIGTNDVVNWMTFASLVDRVGIAASYSYITEVNHPPLSLAILLGLEKLRRATGLETGDLLRLLQSAFDLVALGALLVIGRRMAVPPRELALFYFLSPVTIFVSGFHANTDPSMVALLLVSLALLVAERPRPVAAGVAFAAAVGIKIVPILLLPIVFLWRRDRWRFTAGFTVGVGAVFLPAVLAGGVVVLQRIFGYNAQEGNSGLSYFLFWIARLLESAPSIGEAVAAAGFLWIRVARYVILAAVVAYPVALLARRRREDVVLLAGCGTILLFVLTFSPGGGMQYLVWPIAFLPFVLGRVARWVTVGVFALAQFTVYTIWSGGFPWWYADSTVRRPDIDLTWFANLVWLTMLLVTVLAVTTTLRRDRQPTSS